MSEYSLEMYRAATTILQNRSGQYDNELYHHGVENQKWGVRRYQNPDGSLTPEGVIHYGRYGETGKRMNRETKKQYKSDKKVLNEYRNSAIERREFSEAADRFAKKSERNLNVVKKVFGEDSKITKRSEQVNRAAQQMKNIERAQAEHALNRYKNAVNDAINKYGNTRIKDVKNIKTTKTGEEFVKGYSGWNRDFYTYRDKQTGDLTIQGYSYKTYFVPV